MQKAAVIGIGSNSVRMLVAEVEEDGFRRLTRDRACAKPIRYPI